MYQELNTVIIFGAGGFIGANILHRIAEAGRYKVLAPTRHEVDLLDRQSVVKYLQHTSHPNTSIIFAAARTPYSSIPKDDFDAMSENIVMCQNIVRGIGERGCARIIYLSTIDVYGYADGLITESTLVNPSTNYAAAKASAEFILSAFASRVDIPLLVLRLSQVYGKFDNSPKLIPSLIKSANTTGKIYLKGTGRLLRDYISLDDVTRIIVDSLERDLSETINVVTGKSISTREIADIIAESLNIKTEIVSLEDGDSHHDLLFNNEKLKNTFTIEFTDLKNNLINLTKFYGQQRA